MRSSEKHVSRATLTARDRRNTIRYMSEGSKKTSFCSKVMSPERLKSFVLFEQVDEYN